MADRSNSERLGGFCDGRTDRWTNRWTDRPTDGHSRVAFMTENVTGKTREFYEFKNVS